MVAVLLIESEAPVLRLMGWGLMEEGFQVRAVPSPEEAISVLESYQPDFIVFNTPLPTEACRRAVESLRARTPRAKILDVSPSPDGNARDTGADGYIDYPPRVEDVVAFIRRSET
ncbi:MAG TPA: response regulator [Dehalococcoidia bacterium]|nr:response regulator [Dehalococcoidia bacterium]